MKNYAHLNENMDKFSLYLLVVKIFKINYLLLDNIAIIPWVFMPIRTHLANRQLGHFFRFPRLISQSPFL